MYRTKFKRIGDIIFAVTVLTACAPIALIALVAIRLTSPGPAIFIQYRLGLHGEAFRMYKFRSMAQGAEASGVYSPRNDTRVTRVGRLLRSTSIDELPQLVNVLKGEMSLVGPRPVLTYHPWPIEDYTVSQRRRFDVRPGLTGWAQVNGRKSISWNERLQLDVWYVDHYSLGLDSRIFWRTIRSLFDAQSNLSPSAN